jgi:hypothetical protein
VPGYPIRTPSDQRSVDSSPRTIAASHVLHRLLMPRHPPCALDNLTNTHIKKSRHKCAQKQKMLASTVQFSTTTRTEAAPHPQAKPAPTVPQRQHPPTHGVVLSGPNSVPPALPTTEKTGLSGVSTFLEQPPPTPAPAIKTTHGEVLGPSTTPPQRAEHSPADTTAGEVFGEAP